MDSKLPRKDYFSSTVIRNLLIVSGVETNPGPAGTSENKQGSSQNKSSGSSRSHQNTFRGVPFLKSVFETGAMILHNPDSNPEGSKKPDFSSLHQRSVLGRLDKRKFDVPNHMNSSFENNSMPPIRSTSLDVLSKVLSQQNNKSNEEKIDMITDEIRRLRQESNEKIEFLTQEVERLDKQIREQQDDIDYLHNENVDVKERLCSFYSSLLAKLHEDSNSYRSNNMLNSTSFDMLADSPSTKVAELRSVFETDPLENEEKKSSVTDMIDGPIYMKKPETKSYVDNYVDNINSDSREERNYKICTSRSVSDLRDYFERMSGNSKPRSKSFSEPSAAPLTLQLAVPAQVMKTEESDEDDSDEDDSDDDDDDDDVDGEDKKVESTEATPPRKVADLKALFESKSARSISSRASWHDLDILRKFSTPEPERRKSASGPVDDKVLQQDDRQISFNSTLQWTPNVVF